MKQETAAPDIAVEEKPRGRSRRGLIYLLFPLVVLGAGLALAPERLPRFLLGFAYRGPLVETVRWREWVERNPTLFGPLGETARFAIVESPEDSTGLLFTRGPDGVRVEKTHFLQFQGIPVMLAMPPTAAEELLRLDQREGNKFWDGVKFLVQTRRIIAYVRAPRAELDRVGLTGFLQVLDAIPPKS
ncbi:MAG: hypothetical protein ABR576_04680 [Thermoanaerobaculia bacterium]